MVIRRKQKWKEMHCLLIVSHNCNICRDVFNKLYLSHSKILYLRHNFKNLHKNYIPVFLGWLLCIAPEHDFWSLIIILIAFFLCKNWLPKSFILCFLFVASLYRQCCFHETCSNFCLFSSPEQNMHMVYFCNCLLLIVYLLNSPH